MIQGWTTQTLKVTPAYDLLLVWDEEQDPRPTGIRSILMKMRGREHGMRAAYTKKGEYIGMERDAEWLTSRGIAPEYIDEDSSVCMVGWCDKEQKWYGWCHRAIAGFTIGDMLYDEAFGNDQACPKDHGFEVIRTKADARLSAENYARCHS
jgi:hypothetical protein